MREYLDKRYALALYEIAEEKGKVDLFLEELRQIVEYINKDEDFLKLIHHPQVSTSSKKEIFQEIFKGKIDEDLLSFLLLLIEKRRISGLEGKLIQFEKISLERKNTVIAEIKTVIPLLQIEREELINKLKVKFNKEVILEEEIDKSILGGVYVKVDNEVIDGTVKSKLDEMRKIMLKRE